MQQIFRIGVLASALVIGLAGCAATEWVTERVKSTVDKLESQGTPPEVDEGTAEEPATVASVPSQNPRPPVRLARRAKSKLQTVHVLFGFNRWHLNRSARTDLMPVIKRLRENPRLTVDLEGYADSVGAQDYNLQLSQKRVEAVRDYLVEKGVEPVRIRSVARGQVNSSGGVVERARNRRVTVKLTGD